MIEIIPRDVVRLIRPQRLFKRSIDPGVIISRDKIEQKTLEYMLVYRTCSSSNPITPRQLIFPKHDALKM